MRYLKPLNVITAMIILTKSFSKGEEEKKGRAGKIAAGVAAGTAATGALGYAGLRVGKKKLEEKAAKQLGEYNKAHEAFNAFERENVEGFKNRVKTVFSPKYKEKVAAAEEKLNDKVSQAFNALDKTESKIKKIDRVLDAPKQVVDKIKAAAKSPKAQAMGRKAKGTAVVLERKTRQILRGAAKDVRGLIKK